MNRLSARSCASLPLRCAGDHHRSMRATDALANRLRPDDRVATQRNARRLPHGTPARIHKLLETNMLRMLAANRGRRHFYRRAHVEVMAVRCFSVTIANAILQRHEGRKRQQVPTCTRVESYDAATKLSSRRSRHADASRFARVAASSRRSDARAEAAAPADEPSDEPST